MLTSSAGYLMLVANANTILDCRLFWGKNFAKVNAQAMFNEVDDDGNEEVTFPEWVDFWKNVLAQDCYTEEDIAEAGELV